MENLAQLAPLAILIPSVGAFINIFWGARMNERWSAMIGSAAAILSFLVAFLLFSYLTGSGNEALVINPPLLDGWIRIESIGLDIPWQIRVDSLSVTMMLVVTGVGSLIHIYAAGYMHGDPKFARFFAFLNMFLAFMLTLVMGNNFLMMFVGWEGVGLCSYLLIGFWWDKKAPEGWKNSNAARKAFIINRIGDFGFLMAIFLMFWTFGTLNFYSPGEINNVHLAEEHAKEHKEEALSEAAAERPALEGEESAEGEHSEEAAAEEGEHSEEAAAEESGHGEAAEPEVVYINNDHIAVNQLGVFNQSTALLELEEDGELVYGLDAEGHEITRTRQVDLGGFSLDISTVITLITLFMLLGAAGKSAQIPLFVWLPDAMAGPTPVSALIHAATMVTAGVYMMVRSNVFFDAAEFSSLVVTIIGAATAIMAGYIALGQWDIKRVLAYSTISQLGFMVAAVGVGAYVAAMFHLITHAFFKALLFLGSGSVIHGVEHGHHHAQEHGHGDHHDEHFDPQDMRNMGGLRRKMPATFWLYMIATLALAGIPPFAGFWSKDEILSYSWNSGFVDGELKGFIALGLLLAAAGFTAFYMWRQMEMVFFGKARTAAAENAPESGSLMILPLIVLGVLSLFGGFLNVPSGAPIADGVYKTYQLEHFLEYSLATVRGEDALPFNLLLAVIATGLALVAIFAARAVYGHGRAIQDNKDRLQLTAGASMVWSLANARLYWDEIYFRLIENPFNKLSKLLADRIDWDFLHDYFHDRVLVRGFNAIGKLLSEPFDLGLIDGAVNGIGRLTGFFSGRLRRIQTGYVRTYAVALLLGVVAVIIIMLLPLIQNG